MAETRTKVYQGLQAQQRDEADAAAHGWKVVSRESDREGYRVTYQLGSAWAPTPAPTRRRGLRKAAWLVIVWNVALLALWLVVVPNVRGYINGSYLESVGTFGQSALMVALGFVWLIGFLVTGLIWLISRPRA